MANTWKQININTGDGHYVQCIIHYTATHRYADCSAIHTLSCNVVGTFDKSSITDWLYKIVLQFLIDLNSIHPCLLTCGGQYQSVKHWTCVKTIRYANLYKFIYINICTCMQEQKCTCALIYRYMYEDCRFFLGSFLYYFLHLNITLSAYLGGFKSICTPVLPWYSYRNIEWGE